MTDWRLLDVAGHVVATGNGCVDHDACRPAILLELLKRPDQELRYEMFEGGKRVEKGSMSWSSEVQ